MPTLQDHRDIEGCLYFFLEQGFEVWKRSQDFVAQQILREREREREYFDKKFIIGLGAPTLLYFECTL